MNRLQLRKNAEKKYTKKFEFIKNEENILTKSTNIENYNTKRTCAKTTIKYQFPSLSNDEKRFSSHLLM